MHRLRLILIFKVIGAFLACAVAPCVAAASVEVIKETVPLARGAFAIGWYRPVGTVVKGRVVLGSGDGGWSYWEERVASHLAVQGWWVAGVDFEKYAETDYTQKILAADYARLVEELGRRAGEAAVAGQPVVYGGWSMGAEQSLPAAADLQFRPSELKGLLLVAPGARGRYGLHTADKLGLTPKGEGTFALADFAPQIGGLRIAQLHAGFDPLDSISWYDGLRLDLRLWKYPRAWHDFDGASTAFLTLLDKALAWLVKPSVHEEDKP